MTQHGIRNTQYAIRDTHHTRWLALISVLLITAAFRLAALDAVPPGLHHDEVIIAQVAKDILRGRLAIYFPEGYGHEPLYHYILAGMFAVGGANEFTLRLTTALLGILTVAAVYRMAREMFGRGVALASAAWMAVSLWPIFYSRIGLRNITLPLMISLTTWLFWKAFQGKPAFSKKTAIAAGGVLGLTFYTYQGSRVFPLVFLAFAVYMAVLHRQALTQRWKGYVLFFAVAALVAAPLAGYLLFINPQAEARVGNLLGPVKALLTGDPAQVLQLAIATAGMFTVRGDGVWLYNVGGRPVFPEPLGGALFYLGLLVALWRWRQPAYALLLIWLPVSLAPAALTWPAPNFVRALGALPVVFILPAIAIKAVTDLLRSKLRPVCIVAVIALLAWNATLTARDYFAIWPRNAEVRWLYQATWTQAARWLDSSADTTPVAASGLKIHDLDPQTFDILIRRRGVKIKWFDCRTSILLPSSGTMRYISPDYFPCDANLWARFLSDAQIIAQPRWPDTGAATFTAHQFERKGTPPQPPMATWDMLSLLGAQITRSMAAPGSEAELLTFWRVTGRVAPPLAIFVHVIGNDNLPLAQWDGFDFGEAQLEPGDQLVQRHRFIIPAATVPGVYKIVVGVYNPSTMKRLTLPDGNDRIQLGVIQVQ
jgi:4-amino-4-deoxy-L-arabinose transferase-like glycosyltransferase